jgi:hypothetical protein
MWSLLSKDSGLRKQFIDSATEVNATLMYSFVTLIELSQIRFRKQLHAIIEVMDSIDYAFSDANPRNVIQREKKSQGHGEGPFFGINHPTCDLLLPPVRKSSVLAGQKMVRG